MTQTQKELMLLATEILKAKGMRWDGRPMSKVDTDQVGFENRIIKIPAGGKTTWKR